MGKRKKPSGTSTSVQITSSGTYIKKIDYPPAKDEIELLIAESFCEGKPALNPHIARYGSFTKLEPQHENSLDFQVTTEKKGQRWLELTEFAPLEKFGGKYGNIPAAWNAEDMIASFLTLINNKKNKCYGDEVILLIYITHDTLFVPPPVLRYIRNRLESLTIPFETIYFLSPPSKVWQLYPNDIKDDGPVLSFGTSNIIT
ncbi:hypothetical protein ACQ3G7_08665 [Kosakonia oryzendophytica]|uniref:hypothetical protein n=1 Tax=Kosakonia oryzendophytica TaxID=1005665 RepID=UPI003D32EB33